jgi:hypothetical protein
MRRSVTTVLTIVMLIVLAVPAGSATEWKTRATVNSKGVKESSSFPEMRTEAYVSVQVNDPYDVRISFRTTNDKANTVKYMFGLDCSKIVINGGLGPGHGGDFSTIRTKADNTWVHVKAAAPYQGTLGRWCAVQVYSTLDSTARLHTRVQVKNP